MPVSVCLCIVSYRWVHHLVVSSLVLDLEVRGGDADGVVPGELGDASGGLPGGGAGGDSPRHGPADGHFVNCLNFFIMVGINHYFRSKYQQERCVTFSLFQISC